MSSSSGLTLYRLYSAAGELLYIGKSVHRFRRFDEHCRNQPWEIANASFQELPDDAALSAAEIAAIKRECPKYNKAHTVRPPDDDEEETKRYDPQAAATVSRSEAAAMLGLELQSIDGLISAKKLRASKPFRRVLIRVADIEAMLDASAI
jgi:hypothetical protein